MSTTRTAQEKVALGFNLSEADIQNLLDNPESFRRKLDNVVRAEVAANELAIIEYFETVFLEQRIGAQLKRDEERKEEYRSEKQVAENVAKSQQQGSTLPLEQLLTVKQDAMNATALAAHHLALATTLSHLLSTHMSPSVTSSKGTTLNIPATIAPVVSATQVLKRNKTLRDTVVADPQMAKAFAAFHAKMETGPLATIKTYNQVLAENKIESLETAERKELMRLIDSVLFNINKNNPGIAQQLLRGNELSVRLFRNKLLDNPAISLPEPAMPASLGKPPAMFGVNPYHQAIAIVPQLGKRKSPEDDVEQQPAKRIRTK